MLSVWRRKIVLRKFAWEISGRILKGKIGCHRTRSRPDSVSTSSHPMGRLFGSLLTNLKKGKTLTSAFPSFRRGNLQRNMKRAQCHPRPRVPRISTPPWCGCHFFVEGNLTVTGKDSFPYCFPLCHRTATWRVHIMMSWCCELTLYKFDAWAYKGFFLSARFAGSGTLPRA